ncbi:MAG: 4Fe-4S cluster-binding domain-containing protein, partial [Elusimicrobiales bacterium]|nr:4Fe-4S cluster-binding domain-containing protein [Elusimicrobiales bacterium]
MRILGTQYSLNTKSFEIYIAGCSGNPHCEGCHNPESWNFNNGNPYNLKYFLNIKEKIELFDTLIENIMIFGGEPLDQDKNELINFLKDLKFLNKKIWLFTRYELEEVPLEIKDLCDYIKTGRYIKELTTNDNIQFG